MGKTVANYVSALLISLHARDRTHLAELVNTCLLYTSRCV